MLFVTFFKASFAILAVLLSLLLIQEAEAHSYADCIDWRFKGLSWSNNDGVCRGYARRFPVNVKPFAKLDSDNPNRHYQQSHKDPNNSLACSNGKQGEEPGADETMGNPISAAYNGTDSRGRKTGIQTISSPGGKLCIRWPAKNHAVEKTQPVKIALSVVNPKRDPTQREFLDNIIAELDYRNCTKTKGQNTDIWPCGGCFNLPTKLMPGNFVMQWRWKLNSNEWYTSCADINVVAPPIAIPPSTATTDVGPPPSPTLASPTTVSISASRSSIFPSLTVTSSPPITKSI